MNKSEFVDNKPVDYSRGVIFDGIPVHRQRGMIYWYSWGDHVFDIRTMRKVLGLPEESATDKWFMAEKPDPCGSFSAIMDELHKALNGMPFADAMRLHDAEIEAGWERERKRAASAPAFETESDCPF